MTFTDAQRRLLATPLDPKLGKVRPAPDSSYDFWARVDIRGIDDCWRWRMGGTKSGYGQFRIKRDGKWVTEYTHRHAFAEVYGPAGDLNVCHRCDNPPCCNPLHLFGGSWEENMEDMRRKGRQATGDRSGTRTHPERYPRGEMHFSARLTADAVRAIRQLRAEGALLKDIAARYGVATETVFDAVHGKTWKAVQ